MRTLRIVGLTLVFGVSSFSMDGWADNYRLHPSPKFTQGTAHIPMSYSKPRDPKVCQTYLDNLRYFAQRNTPMSCQRPIAPHLEKLVRPMEWEDLDPVTHATLLGFIVKRASYGKDNGQAELDLRSDEIKNGFRVFRRAKLALSGTFDNGNHGPKAEAEPFQIVQYGIDVTATDNPSPNWRCIPKRGGPDHDRSSYLKLYIVSQDLGQVHGDLYNYIGAGATGAHLRLISGNPYVEHIDTNGNIILMQLRNEFPIGLESVCLFLFKKSN